MHKKVSVVIPCYNHAAYIEDAVISAVSQTYAFKEIIVIDDGSNNETKEVLERLKPQIDILITQENLGVITARNNGIQQANGEYILTLDADDSFEASFLERAVGILETQRDVGMVTCWASVKNATGTELMVFKPSGADPLSGLFRFNASASLLFRKDCWVAVGGYDKKMAKGYEDWEFAIAVGKKGWKIYVIPELLFNFVRIPNSRNKKAKEFYPELRLYVYKKHQDLFKNDMDRSVQLFLNEIESRNRELEKYKSSYRYRAEKTIKKMLARTKKLFFP